MRVCDWPKHHQIINKDGEEEEDSEELVVAPYTVRTDDGEEKDCCDDHIADAVQTLKLSYLSDNPGASVRLSLTVWDYD